MLCENNVHLIILLCYWRYVVFLPWQGLNVWVSSYFIFYFFACCSSQCCVSRMALWHFHLHTVRNGSSPLFKPPVTHCIFSPMFVTAWAVFRTDGRIMALLRWTTIWGSQAVWDVYVAWIFKSVDNHNKAQSHLT